MACTDRVEVDDRLADTLHPNAERREIPLLVLDTVFLEDVCELVIVLRGLGPTVHRLKVAIRQMPAGQMIREIRRTENCEITKALHLRTKYPRGVLSDPANQGLPKS